MLPGATASPGDEAGWKNPDEILRHAELQQEFGLASSAFDGVPAPPPGESGSAPSGSAGSLSAARRRAAGGGGRHRDRGVSWAPGSDDDDDDDTRHQGEWGHGWGGCGWRRAAVWLRLWQVCTVVGAVALGMLSLLLLLRLSWLEAGRLHAEVDVLTEQLRSCGVGRAAEQVVCEERRAAAELAVGETVI